MEAMGQLGCIDEEIKLQLPGEGLHKLWGKLSICYRGRDEAIHAFHRAQPKLA
jgi:hypothetical protein